MSAQKKAIREKFRSSVFTRDRHQCKIEGCSIKTDLDAHHITDRNLMPKGGYVAANGISLCPAHHEMAEVYHSTGEALEGFHPNDLYTLIGSSYEEAVAESVRRL
jgi:predicted restriction endonuclease